VERLRQSRACCQGSAGLHPGWMFSSSLRGTHCSSLPSAVGRTARRTSGSHRPAHRGRQLPGVPACQPLHHRKSCWPVELPGERKAPAGSHAAADVQWRSVLRRSAMQPGRLTAHLHGPRDASVRCRDGRIRRQTSHPERSWRIPVPRWQPGQHENHVGRGNQRHSDPSSGCLLMVHGWQRPKFRCHRRPPALPSPARGGHPSGSTQHSDQLQPEPWRGLHQRAPEPWRRGLPAAVPEPDQHLTRASLPLRQMFLPQPLQPAEAVECHAAPVRGCLQTSPRRN